MRSSKKWLCVSVLLAACSAGGGSGGGTGGGGGSGGGGGGGSNASFPLDVSSDGRHLVGANGESFLMTGDAAWSLMVALDRNETEDYLEDRRRRGFNTVLVNVIERGFGGPENAQNDEPFTTPNDFTTPNEDYWQHADWVIERAAAKDMLVLLAPAYLGIGCGSQGWCQQMLDQPVSAMESYGRFLGDRYRNRTNLLWVHGGDTRASDHGVASRVNALANAIISRAPNHLHTGHCSRNHSGIDCYDEPWLDVNNTYSNCGDSLEAVHADFERNPAQVFFHIEGNYENSGASLGCLIDQYAWSVIGGGVGHVFGNTPIWRFGAGWEGELDSDGSQAMGHLEDLFESRAWFRLRPDLDGDVLVGGASGGTAVAITGDGETIMIYSGSGTLSVDLTTLSGVSAQAWFFDPTDGSSLDRGVFPSDAVRDYDMPRRGVLVIDDAAAGLARPGTEPY